MSGSMHFKPMVFQEPSYLRASMPYGLWAVPGVLTPFPSGLTHPLRGLPQGPREHDLRRNKGQACGLIRGDAARESEPAPQGTASQGSYGTPGAGRLVLVRPLRQKGSETEVADMQSGLISERHLLC